MCVAAWPEDNLCGNAVLELARKAVNGKKFIVEADPEGARVRVVAVPLVLAGTPRTAIVARFSHGPECSVSADVKHLMQASAWLHVLKPAAAAAPAVTDPGTRAALELLAAALDQRDLQTAALAVVNQLATIIGADRVSLGMRHNGELRLLAVSGSSEFKATTALSLAIRAAMTESLQQGVALHLPEDPAAAARETAAHGVLLREARCAALCTIPFADGSRLVGAVTIEWTQAARASVEARERCQALLALAGPVIAALDRAGRGLPARARDSLAALAHRAIGPQRPVLKLGLICAVALLATSALLSGQHRVASSAVLRGTVQRVVLAPVDGFIATATARPGDVVAADAVLATMDDQALRLEVAKWQADYERLMSEYREAMAVLDSTKVTVLRAELDRAAADYQLAEDNLARAEIRAPIAGVVVSGDFSQSLGAPVQRGATLFELAPLDGYHVSARVSERDIGRLQPGQHGRLLLQALPGTELDLVIERVTPVSEVVEGSNVFEVEARLLNAPASLRPGMQGVAKFDVGRARLLWLWTHDALDWMRIKLWSIGLVG